MSYKILHVLYIYSAPYDIKCLKRSFKLRLKREQYFIYFSSSLFSFIMSLISEKKSNNKHFMFAYKQICFILSLFLSWKILIKLCVTWFVLIIYIGYKNIWKTYDVYETPIFINKYMKNNINIAKESYFTILIFLVTL